jgi:hypothetical protein
MTNNLLDIKHQLELELREAEIKAHRALASYKFERFGYWAGVWVHQNRIGSFRLHNPFKAYVKQAKKRFRNLGR